MTTMRRTDVVMIGLGAAGGVAALPLAHAGLRIVALEAGPWRGHEEFGSDELRNDVRNAMGAVKVNREVPTSRLTPRDRAGPTIAPTLMMNAVGGTSIHYGAFSWRLMPWNFRMRSETLRRYGAGLIPEGSLVEDWPFGYDELEPYYDRVEYLLGVSGKAGNVRGRLDPRGNVLEAPRSREYPLPPLRRSGYTELASDALKRLGWKPFPGPAAIHSEDYDGVANSACQYCGFCSFNGCHTNAKASTHTNAIPRAQATGNLEVRTGARVREILVDDAGRATGVRYVVDGEEHVQPASLVILCSYTYENTRLLLLSRSRAFPRGLSNNAGQVGRGFIGQGYVYAYGLFDQRLNAFGPNGQMTNSDVWDADHFDHSGLGFIGGGGISTLGEAKPIGTATGLPPDVPRWGARWKSWIKENTLRVGGAYVQLDMLPYEDNYLDLDPTTTDDTGMPVVRITFGPKQQDTLRIAFLQEKVERLLKEMGASRTWGLPVYPPVNSHAYGGTRMGASADSSVVDQFGASHEVPGLMVLGASTFLSCGGHNPTQTLQAMAWRSADHVVENWSTIGG